MIELIAGFYLDPSRLKDQPVLDVGCREFEWSSAMHARGHRVVALDPAPDIKGTDVPPGVEFEGSALVSNASEPVQLVVLPNAGASYIHGPAHPNREGQYPHVTVPALTMQQLMSRYQVEHWDAVKLNCEGSEYAILENWPGPIATQLTVSFHEHTGANPNKANPEDTYQRTLNHLKQWYTVERHVKERRPTCPENYWDSLFLLR